MKKGFTLIELLIVIIVVAILAILIITYLNFGRNKAKDALMIEIMGTSLTKFSVEYYLNSPTKNYAAFCSDDATRDLLGKINPTQQCFSDNNKWVVCAQFYSSSAKAWCADNTGVKKEITAGPRGACRAGIRSCP
ncbi:MAG: prepilin-type N-terminal cleavage/methylation domain-containing protein [Patescibacteria group bacterium]